MKGTAIIGVPFKRRWRLRTARERWTEPSTPTYTHSPVETTVQRGATTGTGSRTLEEEGRGLSAAGRRMAHIASLLLRAGDVETNQGPRFPCGCAAKESATPLCSAARTGSGTTPDVSASRQPTSAASPGSGEPGPAAACPATPPATPPAAPRPRTPPAPPGHLPTPTPQPQPPTARRDATPTATATGLRERRPAPPRSRGDRTTAGEKQATAAQDTAVKLQRPGRPTNRAPEAPGGHQAACSTPAGDEADRPGRRTPIPGVQRGRQTQQPERDQPANDTA